MVKVESFLFYLLLLFLPTQFGRHFWPLYAFVLGQRIDYLSPTVYITDIIIICLFLLFLVKQVVIVIPTTFDKLSAGFVEGFHTTEFIETVSLIFRSVTKRFLDSARNDKRVVLFILIFIFLIINILFSQSPQEGLYGLVKLLEIVFLTYYTNNFLRTTLKTSYLYISFAIIFESVLAIAQFFHGSSLDGIFYYFGERTFTSLTPGIANASIHGDLILRPYATFSHPNVLAGFLLIYMTILVFSMEYEVFSIKNLFYWLTITIGTIALLLSLSRVAIVVWILVLLLLAVRFIQKKKLYTKYLILNTLLGCLVVLLFIISPLLPRFSGGR